MKKQPTVEARSTPIFRNTPETLRYFYHPDHIGSTSWVTDSAKNGIQYCEYLPYKKLRFFSSLAFGKTNEFVLHSLPASVGEPFLDQRSTTWNSRYTFSGKERDGETGYSYFGARYYNSDISIWLSVDPLSDKYPNLTPYAYCANNPIKLVDPNGEEIYEFDENGKYIKTSGEEGSADQILIRKTDGSIVAGKEYANGTIKNDFTRSIKQENGNSVDVSFLKIKGDQNAEEAFEFVADNTSVEWSLTNVGAASGDKGISYLSNSQEKSHEGSAGYIIEHDWNIRGHIHSQPNRELTPSKSDCDAAFDLQVKMGKEVQTKIYSSGKYREYNQATYEINEAIKKSMNVLNQMWK